MDYLCKTNPTSQDLARLRLEREELKEVIDSYRLGKVSRDQFLTAVNRLDDLLFLTNKLISRCYPKGKEIRIVKG
jgi:uncharacterized protein YbgA (DUF1722 family)